MFKSMEEPDEKQVLPVRDVCVLMKKDYRISRNIRAKWFFDNLNKTIPFTPKEELTDTDEELQVVSVVPADGSQCTDGNQYNIVLLPSTMVTFVACRYRFVIVLDLSPSVSSVDLGLNKVLYEEIHEALANLLRGIVLPFKLPGSKAILVPEIHVSVICHTPLKCIAFNQVIVQGRIVTEENVEKIIIGLKKKLDNFENILAENFNKYMQTNQRNFASSYCDVRPTTSSPLTGIPMTKESQLFNNPEAGFVSMIRVGMLALQLLPENSSAGLVVITDGCLGVPDANLFEFLLTQLRSSTIACSFIRIGEPRSPFRSFGHVSHVELMQFIATATFGSYFDCYPDASKMSQGTLNPYHEAMFLWSFQRGLEGFRFDLGDQNLVAQQSSPTQQLQRLLSHPIHGKLASVMPNMRKRHKESNLTTSLFSVLSVRLREGYTIRDIAITKGESQLQVRLVLPWREYARFEYSIRAAWPLDKTRPVTQSEITIEGSYDFLHDMTCTKINTRKMSSFRSANVKKFWLALQGLSQTDQLLVHLQSFSHNPVHYTIPASVKEGLPLFDLRLPNSNTPEINTQLNVKDHALNQFASFWKPVVHLDIKVWQKWMHTHRIGLVLEHDQPLHKNIHIPSSSSRFSIVMFRQALTSLSLFLAEWSTFILLDGQSYIKFIYDKPVDKTKGPCSFVLVQMTPKSPCLVVRLAFLGGTPGHERHELVKELKHKFARLQFPQRGPKTDKRRITPMKPQEVTAMKRKTPLRRDWSEIKCCVLLRKPVDSILIRYDRMPRDMTRLEDQVTEDVTPFQPYPVQSKNKTAANMFNSLARYLLHRRWIWTVQQPGLNSISMTGIGRILSTLAKMRLQQWYHFSLSSQGIVNLMAELDMQDDESEQTAGAVQGCVVQYVIFPPHLVTTGDSLSDDDDEMESTEDDGELQIVTETWVEPQHGVCCNNPLERQHLHGLTCHQIPDTFFPSDHECISTLISLEHLLYLCQNSVIPTDLDGLVNDSAAGNRGMKPGLSIQHIDFPFNLLSLLPKSQQAELVYSAYTYDPDEVTSENDHVGKDANYLLYSLFLEEVSTHSQRNVVLSRHQSRLFLEQLCKRQRANDVNPFPFEMENFVSLDEDETPHETDQSDSSTQRDSSQQGYRHPRSSVPSASQKSSSQKFPQWKCFIKSSTTSSLLIIFIPASFDDVVLLNQTKDKHKCGSDNHNETTKPKPDEQNHPPANFGAETRTQPAPAGASLDSQNKSDADNSDSSKSDFKSYDSTPDKAGSQTDQRSETSEATLQSVPEANTNENAKHRPKLKVHIPKPKIPKKAFRVPVYVYDCTTQNVLGSLINPWDFHLGADIYQDLTFEILSETTASAGLTSPRVLKRVSFSLESLKDNEDGVPLKSILRTHDRRSTEGSNEDGESLWQQISAMSEIFSQCYVKGVFHSLQKGFKLDSQDIDAAINNICEESLPLELNMTSFLHASCSHFQNAVSEARGDEERRNDQQTSAGEEQTDGQTDGQTEGETLPDRIPSVRFMDIRDDGDGDDKEACVPIPSVLEIPKVTLNFDPATLHLETPCDMFKDLHQLVKNKFLDTVQKWFRPVAANQEYYFYCPEVNVESDEISDGKETSDSTSGLNPSETLGEKPPEGTPAAVSDAAIVDARDEHMSTASVRDSEESMEDDVDLDLDLTLHDKSDHLPLFINFTCTVKSRLQQYSLPLKSIAVCLADLATILSNLPAIELGDLKITFDLNCLTLPTDVEILSPRKPHMRRMFSTSTTGGRSSTSSESSEDAETVDRSSFSIGLNNVHDVIGHLPLRQHDAVTKCMEEIKWLLHDEIVSNLRHISSIQADALTYTAKHIQSSSTLGKANVSVDNVPLQFVFGPDQSLDKFTEEFQKMNLLNYQLVKEADWYFLSRKRILAYQYVNAKSIGCVVDELNQWNYQTPISSKVCSPASASKSEFSDHQESGKPQRNLSPLVTTKEKVFDIASESIGRSSPLTVKADGQGLCDYSRRLSNEKSLTVEKRYSADGINMEEISWIRRRSKDLVLKMKGSHESISSGERRRSNDTDEGHASHNEEITQKEGRELKDVECGEKTSTDSKDRKDSCDSGPASLAGGNVSSDFCTFDSPSSAIDSITFSNAGSHVTSAVQSPVISDVSIQLTKTDGRCEPFRSSPEHKLQQKQLNNDSFDSEDANEAILKRCSSFAGFRSEESCATIKDDESYASCEHSPEKLCHVLVLGQQGRLRHCSAPIAGHGTPRSKASLLAYTPSCISSRGSFTEDAYDGDQSEMDDSATTFSESGVIRRLMPDFWIIMHIAPNTVDILFQHRETGKKTNEEIREQKDLVVTMKHNVESICRRVNQHLLLNDLYNTRMCHTLLVDAADEDVSWRLDSGPRLKTRHNVSSSENDDEEEDDDTFERKYLAMALDLDPGHFECKVMWKTQFNIHPGLKRGTRGASTVSIGIKTLRSVLNPLSVNNRNNMFVTREIATGNVFYLRLKEQLGLKTSLAAEDPTADGLSMSSSGQLKAPDTPGDRDPDSVSIGSACSSLSLAQSYGKAQTQDCVELCVHGITEAGKETKEDLVQMLQRRLDEAVLEKIFEMLRRNPQCQLDRDDVQFIQKPGSEPTSVLHLTISNKASPQLAAVMFYLRQNLLQFLHPPKYKFTHEDAMFVDIIDGRVVSIPADQAFLYIPLHTARKTGIAVVSVSLVDGQGNQVKLLQCPRPSRLAYTEIQACADLQDFIHTQTYELKPRSKKPGPTALIQFHVWEVGDVDIPGLQERLTLTLRHALCDVAMEYHALTAPLCTLPKHLVELLPPPPAHSAPTSPFFSMQGEEYRERKLSLVMLRGKNDSNLPMTRRSSLQNHSRLQSLHNALIQTKKRMSPAPDSNKQTFELPASESMPTSCLGSPALERHPLPVGSPGSDQVSLLNQYQSGETGTLHTMYADIMEDWLKHCTSLEVPAVASISLDLKSRFSMDYILQEVKNIISRQCPTVSTRVYKMYMTEEEEESASRVGALYIPNRSPFEPGRRRSETSLDVARPVTVIPGQDRNFTCVARSMRQWYSFLHSGEEEEEGGEHITAGVKGKLPSQKFAAHIPSISEGKSFGMFQESTSLIPRQKFLWMALRNKQLELYTYNWSNDAMSTLNKQLTKLVKWNNARTHLLSNVVLQKCGLFNHYLYGDITHSMEKVTQQTDQLDQLITSTAPPLPSKEKLARTQSSSSVRPTLLPFDVTFKDLYPSRPLHLSHLACQTDPIRQYGQQAQDIRVKHKQQFEKINNIRNLYVMWVQKTAPNYPIAENIMRTLKQSSRMFHYCATPLLFSWRWRHNVLEKFKVTRQDSVQSTASASTATPDTKTRSRHGSGTSIGSQRTRRGDSVDLKKRPSSQTLNILQLESVSDEGSSLEEEWHLELRSRFICQYIKYLQTIGFHYVQMDKSQDKDKVKKRPVKPSADPISQGEEMCIKPADTHNLQKTVSGGVLLIEISFRQEYFCVKLFTCDHNKLGITVNQQKGELEDKCLSQELKLLFVDECEKCKALIHVHSFAHDFHLRCIQSYISGYPEVLKPGYFLSGLLTDFVRVYPYAPSFSRNFLQREVVSIPEPSCSSEDLYEYMLKHAWLHAMTVLKMVLPSDGELTMDPITISKNCDYALTSHETREVSADPERGLKNAESYKIGLIILQDTATTPSTGTPASQSAPKEGVAVTSNLIGAAGGHVIQEGGATGNAGRDVANQSTVSGPVLRLQFYLILTSSNLMFPKANLDKERGVLIPRTLSLGDSSVPTGMGTDFKIQIAGKKTPSLRHATNYLGYANKHQPPMYRLLQEEAKQVREKIERMARVSMEKCRRDNLWTRLLMHTADDPASKKRADSSDKMDPLKRLSFDEFHELLDRVHKVPLYEMDDRLVPFLHMNQAWYLGLANVLNNRYPDNMKRCFTSPDNSSEKHLLILNPKFLDLFMMLSIDSQAGKTGLYAVFRKPAKEQESICPGSQNLPEQSVHSHMEHFINTCCFHLWSCML